MKETGNGKVEGVGIIFTLTLVITCRCIGTVRLVIAWYATIYYITGFEDTRGTIIIVDVSNIIQKVSDTGIHLKVDKSGGETHKEVKGR